MQKAKLFLGLFLSVVLIASCAGNQCKSDAKSVSDSADRAIEAAVATGAEQYAPEELAKARELYEQAVAAYKDERYDEAAGLFRQAREWADKARRVAADRQRELGIKVEAAPLVASASCAIATDVASASIYFDFDKSNIRSDQQGALTSVAACLKQYPGTRVILEGHTDERGSNAYNMALGDRRANSVKRSLEIQGIGGLSTISYGEEKPVDPGHDEGAWAKNRRVDFTVK